MVEIVFFTSSPVKLAHARYLCRDYAVRISRFREKTFGANYEEPRIYDRTELIERSYSDALQRWKKFISPKETKLFFIEDTSVIIDALSQDQEFPGLDVKYWMRETDFIALDEALKEKGNNRRCSIRSDLVLHLPPELRPQKSRQSYRTFTSFSFGSIVEREYKFETNLFYPWLDNKTFNKWFVPEGYQKPISLLPIAEADKFDFRANAFMQMLGFLENHGVIKKRSTSVPKQFQLEASAPLFIICGPSCAGKTTLAEYLVNTYGYYHIEASDFMYRAYYQRHGVISAVPIGDFAEQALRDQPEIVAEQILEDINVNQPLATVITGFRSLDEVTWFREHYDGHQPISLVYVDAAPSIRYERGLSRGRELIPDTKQRFEHRDAQQFAMGLGQMSFILKNETIRNEGNHEAFFNQFNIQYFLDWLFSKDINSNKLHAGELEKLILKALLAQWDNKEYFTTTEIAHLINSQLKPEKQRSKNNVSRYFNQRFYPYYEIQLVNDKRKYRLSNTGYGKAKLL